MAVITVFLASSVGPLSLLSLAGPSLIKSDHVLRQCFANPWNTQTMLQEASMWLTALQ